jgi:dihydroxyacid dehydratase/phosphogluconate dehydratase
MAESRLNHGWITGQAYGKYIAGTISEEDRKDIVRKACPGPGACGGMYTANTMATATEAVYGCATPCADVVGSWVIQHGTVYKEIWTSH